MIASLAGDMGTAFDVAPSHPHREAHAGTSPLVLGAIAVGLVAVVVVVLLLFRASRRRGQSAPGGLLPLAPARPPPGWKCAEGWQAAAAALESVGLTKLDAECYWDRSGALFVKLHLTDGSLRGWLDRSHEGGMLERYLGASEELRPGVQGGSALAQFVIGEVGEVLRQLPAGARLSVKAPEMPGDSASLNLTTPFTAPDQPAIVARVLLMLDQAAARPAPAGPPAQMPAAATCWQAAASGLEALGMTKLDAECYMRGKLGESLFVKVHVRDASLRGWLERPYEGGVLERHLGATAELHPGEQGRSELAQLVAREVGELLGQLPRAACLSVKAPDMPGASYELNLTTPSSTPDQAAILARTLIALDEAARRTVAAGSETQMPPAVRCWLAAGPALEALGMTKLDAECFMRGELGQALFVKVHIRDATLRGWIERACEGGVLEHYAGADAELHPGDPGRSELALFLVREVGEALASLPRAARLSVKAPDMRGASYELSLTTPFATPDQAATVARVLLRLDEVAQRASG